MHGTWNMGLKGSFRIRKGEIPRCRGVGFQKESGRKMALIIVAIFGDFMAEYYLNNKLNVLIDFFLLAKLRKSRFHGIRHKKLNIS